MIWELVIWDVNQRLESNPSIRPMTPNIDALATNGMLFTQAYSVCSPSRASMLTGRNTGHCSIRENPDPASLLSIDITMGQVMKDRGYDTYYVGKWRVASTGNTPNNQGFNQYFV